VIHRVHANGVDFAYLQEGTGPLVVLLHGFPDTAHTWDRTMRELAQAGFRAVAPFMRGYYPTAVPEDRAYDPDTLGKDALAIIEALGEKSAIVVGHDWGAAAAYSAAALGPDRVRLLVTLAIPHPKALKPSPGLAWAMRHFLPLRRKSGPAKVRANDFAYVDELWRRWSPAWQTIPASETAKAKEAFAQPGCLEAACAYYAAVTPPRLPPSHKLQIKVPSVAFAGEHDGLMVPRKYEKARHCFEASYEVVQVPGGHFMHREHPEPFITELVRVLRDHDARSGAAR
jgi:pimeloyl-ACP methyl ester carboxylesterase